MDHLHIFLQKLPLEQTTINKKNLCMDTIHIHQLFNIGSLRCAQQASMEFIMLLLPIKLTIQPIVIIKLVNLKMNYVEIQHKCKTCGTDCGKFRYLNYPKLHIYENTH